RPLPRDTLFPYTTLFRSLRTKIAALAQRNLLDGDQPVSADDLSDDELLRYTNTYFGTVDEVAQQFADDKAANASTEVSFQVHSQDPGHDITMRSLELLGTQIAPALGWSVTSETHRD